MEGNQSPRRKNPRLRLGIQALLISLEGQEKVILQDLSETGAKVLRQSKEPLGKGVLQWMHYEIYGEVVWQRGPWVGFQFDRHLEETVLLETRAAAPCLIKDQAKEIEHYAQEFVQGRPVSR